MPEAAISTVTPAGSCSSDSASAERSEATKVPSSASPATAGITPSGASAISCAKAVAPRPHSTSTTPDVVEAIQRRSRSSPASGPAARAAVIAARFTPCPPSGAPIIVPRPVVTIDARHGTS